MTAMSHSARGCELITDPAQGRTLRTRFGAEGSQFVGEYDGQDPEIVDPGTVDPRTFPPVPYRPGSNEKIDVMSLRYELGLPLFHPDDRVDHEHVAAMTFGGEYSPESFGSVADDLEDVDLDAVDDPMDLERPVSDAD